MIVSGLVIIISFLFASCYPPKPRIRLEEVKVYITATPGTTKTLNSLVISTQTATITPTPTPTAPSFREIDNITNFIAESPISQPDAPCGFVDYFDFPLDAPNGTEAQGGADYSIFRSRYGKFHTGEDWRYSRVRNFRAPVYSIGHGVVTYAEPLGWGADQGVIIVRHSFRDGSDVLSFYGHLDPPSVNLNPGSCVQRGDWIGSIGNPRTSPHLHFEIRSHMPFGPGPGYWSTDPNLAGWYAPSRYIWSTRMAHLPAVQWENSSINDHKQLLGVTGENSLAVLSGQEIISIDMQDGRIEWHSAISNTVDTGILDHAAPILYTSDQLGVITALAVPDITNRNTVPPILDIIWQIDTDVVGIPDFIPLQEGGMLLTVYDHIIQFSSAGEIVWQGDQIGPLEDWVQHEAGVWFSTRGGNTGIWHLEDSGPRKLIDDISGKLSYSADKLYIYSRDGLYAIPENSNTAEKLVDLANAFPIIGDMMALDDGSILLAHMDRDDRKLIMINPTGEVEWERSYASIMNGTPSLMQISGRIYILNEQTFSSNHEITIYEVIPDNGELEKVFVGGSRRADTGGTWFHTDDMAEMVLNIGGGSLVGMKQTISAEEQ